MPNRVIELVQQLTAEQNKPHDPDKETDEAYLGRRALEDSWIGNLCYKGNSISWSHSKSVNYGRELHLAWEALRKLGVPCDGNTTVAEAVAKFCVKASDG